MKLADKVLFQLVKRGCKDDNGECRYCYNNLTEVRNSFDPCQHSDWCVFMEAVKYLVNRELDDEMTIGECYEPAMWIADAETAAKYLRALVTHSVRFHGIPEDDALSAVKENIGYYSGYFDPDTARRCIDLFCAVHPIFGASIATPKQAFEAGYKLGKGDGE